ncbi:hypothetical protein KSP40_PGU020380 [Platanthera guangdongensis]|uniref:AIPP2-like SPOC-like domain-containing protein n=1 Tax=Platanthera guangdongensis TaxID=2320717 RepID=A0ABR2M346_9ASPA
MATCCLCKVSSEHTYCMPIVNYEVPEKWQCEECLLKAKSVSNIHAPGKQEEKNRVMGSTLTKINCRRIEDGKVKFLTRDEAVTLVSGKRPRENLCISGHHANVADFKPPLISSKAVTPALPSSAGLKSPSRAMKGPAYVGADISSSEKTTEIKRGNRETEVIARVCKMKPDKFKGGADDGCTDKHKETQVTAHACKMKQDKFRAGADDGLTDKHKENKGLLKPQDDNLFRKDLANASLAIDEKRTAHKKIEASASRVIKTGHKIVEANAPPINDSGSAVRSISQIRQISSQEMFLPLKLIVNPDENHHHALEACWRGAFEVLDLFTQFHGTVHAHLSCQVSPKVYDVSKHFPGTLKLKLLPRESLWPKIFKVNGPTKDDIALYFKCEVESHKEKYDHFLQQIHSNDYALQSCVANVELLIFTSAQLLIHSQKFDKFKEHSEPMYLWGVFRHVKRKNASHGEEEAASCSTSSHVHLAHDKSMVPHVSSLEAGSKVNMVRESPEEVDMEIDMAGGLPVGRIDMPIKLRNAPFGFSESSQRPPVNLPLNKSSNSALFDAPPGFLVPKYKRLDSAPR